MNYFAHGRHYVQTPFLLAGTAVPDWLNVVDRRAKARSKSAVRFLASRDQRLVQLAAGILRHHHDDRWFHQTRAFAELCWEFTVAIRDRLPPDDGLRPSFLGHILVELLLDDYLIQQNPTRLHEYYRALDQLDPEFVAWAVSRIATRPVPRLGMLIPRFSAERFLYDYAEDGKLLVRLNHVMARVRLPALPDTLCTWLPAARQRVACRAGELLEMPESNSIEERYTS